ncbi:hypothetical protein BC938DRAFT_478365 [Jimgerdemannia flammicorona]|uniref:Restriction endonuclease type IV Mrr domain-containing protein n=1 Tax=Jimgerdemannia flammicorona TaxID=994334 RepID=A0A433QYB3_9FUNG|nr:hypothetical protein BC938DRAFT_478365 [Jimgerdemannia flammicorona]
MHLFLNIKVAAPRLVHNFATTSFYRTSRCQPIFQKTETLVDYLAKPHKNPTSTVFKGTSFELEAKEVLEKYGMRLHHSGGRGDKGVDLRGIWQLEADQNSPPYIIAQCKNVNKKCQPEHIRSLIGTVVAESRTEPTIGIFVTSNKNFTKEVVADFKSCHLPLMLVKIADCQLKSLALNPAAEKLLPGYAVTTRFTTQGVPEVVFTFDGRIVELPTPISKETANRTVTEG